VYEMNTTRSQQSDRGNALIGIIVIMVILIAGAVSFWNTARQEVAQNEAARKAAENSTSANVIWSIPPGEVLVPEQESTE